MKAQFDIGDEVVCDFCNTNFTHSDETGGFLFGSYGTCPQCSPRIEADAQKYGEEKYIMARAEPDETFKAFILRIRGGNNTATIYSKD